MAAAAPSVVTYYTETPQYANRLMLFSAISGALVEGKFDATLTSGGTGIYTITFNNNYARPPEGGVTVKTDNRFARITAVTEFAITVEIQDLTGGAAIAGDFALLVLGSEAKDPIRG